MGRDRPIRYVLQLYSHGSVLSAQEWRTRARYGVPGYGAPTEANLKRYLRQYNKSLLPGGANAHIGTRGRATGGFIKDQKTGRVLVDYRRPMFSTDPMDFDE